MKDGMGVIGGFPKREQNGPMIERYWPQSHGGTEEDGQGGREARKSRGRAVFSALREAKLQQNSVWEIIYAML